MYFIKEILIIAFFLRTAICKDDTFVETDATKAFSTSMKGIITAYQAQISAAAASEPLTKEKHEAIEKEIKENVTKKLDEAAKAFDESSKKEKDDGKKKSNTQYKNKNISQVKKMLGGGSSGGFFSLKNMVICGGCLVGGVVIGVVLGMVLFKKN
ncbi:hypothetical protein H312_02039 [Anncaliia algerae PRA339]|uniref:Uncharacterized protein n=1 Tax=Anncaliia algerae PRA339 TaxID=1288291 RepID=A0A059EWU5_9MICR|nr:hypothetical protein H312_03224 [Anncaliia algerae PRA339]KCZ80553.1 hypothetical protein H312_02039 [Anncaliia algerae PRA339]